MIVRNRRATKSRKRCVKRARPALLDFPQIRKEVKLFSEVGVVIKSFPTRNLVEDIHSHMNS
jgi:hypothetical protein